jgi:hypothetical protein
VNAREPDDLNRGAKGLIALSEQLRGRGSVAVSADDLLHGAAAPTGLWTGELRRSLSEIAEREAERWRQGILLMEATFRRNLPENWL